MSKINFINNQKALYKSLQSCYCPAIKETVHFSSDGLNHILYHRRRPRNINERIYRASLISYLIEVVTNASTAIEINDSQFGGATLWIIEYLVKDLYRNKRQVIKIVLCKKKNGNVHFLSVMSKLKGYSQ